MAHTSDTIFALSSGRPPAAIAVVRVSGPRAGDALRALTGRTPEPRRAALARIRDPDSGELIDEALALWFPAPKSETGEDVAELQLHGGRAVIAATLAALGRIEGLRPAQAGEFTRRAFTNGYLDLTEVEGLADLIAAETEAQRRQALRQMKGLLGDRAEEWRRRLIAALALVEAGIDFPDEEVPDDLALQAKTTARQLLNEVERALADAQRGERLRDGIVVAIAGPPNAGKSTLLNRIARRDAAIVSPHAGTTRDVIEVHLDLGGYPVTLLDTAGLRESDDPVEQEGVDRARRRAAAADLVLWVTDAREPVPPPVGLAGVVWEVRNKCDLVHGGQADAAGAETAMAAAASAPAAAGQTVEALRQTGLQGRPEARGLDRGGVPDPTISMVSEGHGPLLGRGWESGLRASPIVEPAVLGSEASGAGCSGDAVPAGDQVGGRRLVGDRLDAGGSVQWTGVSGRSSLRSEDPSVLCAGEGLGLTNLPGEGSRPAGATGRYEPSGAALKENESKINNESSRRTEPLIETVSARSGERVERLIHALTGFADRIGGGEPALITRERHRADLVQVRAALRRALDAEADELIAEELRLAANALGRLTGRIDVEDVLDSIFRDFCIGK